MPWVRLHWFKWVRARPYPYKVVCSFFFLLFFFIDLAQNCFVFLESKTAWLQVGRNIQLNYRWIELVWTDSNEFKQPFIWLLFQTHCKLCLDLGRAFSQSCGCYLLLVHFLGTFCEEFLVKFHVNFVSTFVQHVWIFILSLSCYVKLI